MPKKDLKEGERKDLILALRINENFREELESIAEKYHINKSMLITNLLEDWMKKFKKNTKKMFLEMLEKGIVMKARLKRDLMENQLDSWIENKSNSS